MTDAPDLQHLLDAQARAAAAFHLQAAPLVPLPPAGWRAVVHDDPILRRPHGYVGGTVRRQHDSDAALVAIFGAAQGPYDAIRAAAVVVHELAHLVAATIRADHLVPDGTGDGHDGSEWRAAIVLLAGAAWDRQGIVATLADPDASMSGRWPHHLRDLPPTPAFAALVKALGDNALPDLPGASAATPQPQRQGCLQTSP